MKTCQILWIQVCVGHTAPTLKRSVSQTISFDNLIENLCIYYLFNQFGVKSELTTLNGSSYSLD